jgi:Response regulator containing CheY-like receiver domain and AraC-type DNA-binding domain
VLCGPNCKVTSAADGGEALAKIAASEKPYDIVITDHQMPRVTGLELVRQLTGEGFRRQNRRPLGFFERGKCQGLQSARRGSNAGQAI